MDSEPRGNPENKVVSDQTILKGIFDAVNILSEGGEEHVAGRFLSKDYPQHSPVIGWDNLRNIFVAQLTEKGRREMPKVQDRNIVLAFQGGEIESIDYRLYEENGSYRIKKEEGFKGEMKKPPENWFEALEGFEKGQQARDLERKLGYSDVDDTEAQKLLELLKELLKGLTKQQIGS